MKTSWKHMIAGGAALAALAAGLPPALAQTAGGAASTAAAGQGAGAQQLAAAEQSLRQAIAQMTNATGAGVAGALQSARQALSQLQQAMAATPADRRNTEAWRNLEREVNQANAALTGDRPDMTRARTELDQVIVLIPAFRTEMGMAVAGATPSGAAGANIVIREQSAQVQVQQAQPQVTVTQPEPIVTVVVPPPEIIVRQPPPQVTVQIPQPQVAVAQQQPQVRVVEAQPQVQVQAAQPQIQVQQAQPRVTVQQQGQPQVRVEQQGQPVVNIQREAQATGAAVAPAPAQGAGAQPAAAGIPLARVQSLVGTNVVGSGGRDAGEVENLLIDRNGQVRAAVIEWGGFLGIGERRAVVPIEQIQFGTTANDRARLNMTREQLEALGSFDRSNLNQYGSRYGWGEGIRLFR